MKVLQVAEYGAPLELAEWDRPRTAAGEVLVNVRYCAIAVGERLVQSGQRESYRHEPYPLPHVPGFQGMGRVVEAHDERERHLVGEDVVINGLLACGACSECGRGRENHCGERGLLGLEPGSQGCLAEYVSVPARNVHVWPSHLEPASAPFVSELSTAYHLARRTMIDDGDTVICIGAGQTGVMAIPVARMRGATTIIVIDRAADRLELARSLGATHVIDAAREDPLARAQELLGDRGADVVLEMVGVSQTVESAIRLAGTHGRVGLLGVEGDVAFDLPDYSAALVAKELRLFGCFSKEHREFAQVIASLAAGSLDISQLPVRVYPLQDHAEAWAHACRSEQQRVVVEISPGMDDA